MEIKQFKPKDHKIKALIYGASGTGKTTFASTAPNPIYASAEGGLLSVADKGVSYTDIKTVKDLQDLLEYLKTQDHDFKTVIIDSITEINDIIKAGIEKKSGRPMQLQDWGVVAKKIEGILRGFRELPMHVIIIAQELVEKDEDKISKILPSLNGKAKDKSAYFMDVVGYLKIEKGTGERTCITSPHHKLASKDRTNKIGNDCPVDFSEWVERVKGIEVGEEKVVASHDSDEDVLAEQKPTKKPATKKTAPAKTTPTKKVTKEDTKPVYWKHAESDDFGKCASRKEFEKLVEDSKEDIDEITLKIYNELLTEAEEIKKKSEEQPKKRKMTMKQFEKTMQKIMDRVLAGKTAKQIISDIEARDVIVEDDVKKEIEELVKRHKPIEAEDLPDAEWDDDDDEGIIEEENEEPAEKQEKDSKESIEATNMYVKTIGNIKSLKKLDATYEEVKILIVDGVIEKNGAAVMENCYNERKKFIEGKIAEKKAKEAKKEEKATPKKAENTEAAKPKKQLPNLEKILSRVEELSTNEEVQKLKNTFNKLRVKYTEDDQKAIDKALSEKEKSFLENAADEIFGE